MKTESPEVKKQSTDSDLPKPTVAPRVMQTPEDAVMAYLRGELSEDEMRNAFAALGGTVGTVNLPDDSAFAIKIPEDMKVNPKSPYDDPEYAKAQADKKQAMRDAAEEAAKKVRDDKIPLTADVFADAKNEAANEAADEVEKKENEKLAKMADSIVKG